MEKAFRTERTSNQR